GPSCPEAESGGGARTPSRPLQRRLIAAVGRAIVGGRHGDRRCEAPMLFTCRLTGTPIPGRFPGPAHARGKWFTIDIHCHLRSDKAAAMVAGNDAVSRWFLETAANEHSQSINRQNGERTHLQGMSAEQRIADMDHMGIDIQAV